MALYELRTYTLYVGKMAEATKLYQELGFPALKKGGHDKKLVDDFKAWTAPAASAPAAPSLPPGPQTGPVEQSR